MIEKDQYVEKAKARIDQWNAEIDKMSAEAAEASADARIEYQKQIEELRRQRDETEKKFKELQNASGGAWDDMKTGLDKALDSMSQAFDSAWSRFK